MLRIGRNYFQILKIPSNFLCFQRTNATALVYPHPTCPQSYHDTIRRCLLLYPDFVTEDEEKSLVDEIEPIIQRRRYENDHWDDAIRWYRETDRSSWNQANARVFQRVRETAFPPNDAVIEAVHVLDLADKGWIQPHVDSVRFCGNIIAGLSLLTDSVMRFVLEGDEIVTFDALLKRRSLYIMRDEVRFKFKHEILKNEESEFNGIRVEKGRRISLMCRNQKCSNPEVI